jgi:hypothetical protein
MIENIEEKLQGVIISIPASYAALTLAGKENDYHGWNFSCYPHFFQANDWTVQQVITDSSESLPKLQFIT